jgi:hypothetical protein
MIVTAETSEGLHAAAPTEIPKRKVRLDCGQYILRTITVEDATDRWAHWMEDPEASDMLNAPRKAMTREDLVAYIKSFDQRTRILRMFDLCFFSPTRDGYRAWKKAFESGEGSTPPKPE